MSEKEHKRDNSRAADTRARQDDAAKGTRRWFKREEAPITDLNAESFLKKALRNGLDLARIAREAAEKAKAEDEA